MRPDIHATIDDPTDQQGDHSREAVVTEYKAEEGGYSRIVRRMPGEEAVELAMVPVDIVERLL